MVTRSSDEVNDVTSVLIKSVGREIAALGDYPSEMVCLEGVTAGLIASCAIRYNRQPDELVEAFVVGVKERLDSLIYGKKQ